MTPEPDESEERQPEIVIEPAQMAGVWANAFTIAETPHEFTLDFIRMDGRAPPPGRGIVVARVAFSALMASELAEVLPDVWRRYARVPDRPEGQDDGPEGSEATPQG